MSLNNSGLNLIYHTRLPRQYAAGVAACRGGAGAHPIQAFSTNRVVNTLPRTFVELQRCAHSTLLNEVAIWLRRDSTAGLLMRNLSQYLDRLATGISP